jgi:hypothetical protein
VLLSRDGSYVLVELDETGILRLAALRTSPERIGSKQLLGTTLRASMGSSRCDSRQSFDRQRLAFEASLHVCACTRDEDFP